MKRKFLLVCIVLNIKLLSYCQVQVTQPYIFKSYIQAPVVKLGASDSAGTKKSLRDTSAIFRSLIDARIKYSDTLTKIATRKLLFDSIFAIREDLPIEYMLTSNILEADNINHTFKPYSNKQPGLNIYTGTENTDGTIRININGYWHATKLVGLFSTPSSYVQINDASSSNTAFFGTKTGTSSIFNKSGTLDAAENNPTVKIERTVSGTGNTTGSLLRIDDNPTTSGTISGSLIEGYIGITKRTDLNPRVADGASAEAYVFDTHNALSTPGAKHSIFKNQGITKAKIDKDGVFYSNVPFISLYRNTDLTVPLDLNIWAKITGLTTKHSSILTKQGDSITLSYAGIYRVSMVISSYDGTNVDYEYGIFKNSILEESSQILTNTTNTYNVVCAVTISSDGDDWISFKVRNILNSNDPTLKKVSIIINPISLSL